jgi:hypothetical protein
MVSLLLLCCLTDVACSESKSGAAYDVNLRRLDLIPPGTVIDKEAPKGWTKLIIKSRPRPGAGDVKKLSATADRMSRLLFTAILANVKTERTDAGPRHRLANVAVGLGTRIGDKDTIVNPDTQKKLGANLGIVARVVLNKAHKKLDEIRVVARSNTLLVFDAPGLMVLDERHKPVVLRYAVLIEEKTGQLDTLLWVLDRAERGEYRGPVGPIEWLQPNKMEDCVLHVDASQFSLGQPTEDAFAMMRAPKGQKQLAIHDTLKSLAVRQRFSATTAGQLESELRETLRRANGK